MAKAPRSGWARLHGMLMLAGIAVAAVQATPLPPPAPPAMRAAAPTLPPARKHPTAARPVPPRRPARPMRPAPPAAITYSLRRVRGIAAHVVPADLSSPSLRVSVATASGGIGDRDSWEQFIARTRPTAAITGTYFDLGSAVPVGSIVVGGKPVHWGPVRSVFSFHPPGRAVIRGLRTGERFDWYAFETALRAGPLLVADGKIVVAPRREGFRDPGIWARKRRSMVGITRRQQLFLVSVAQPVTLSRAAQVMRALGARDALCLDGDGSAGLYYRGKTPVRPGRALTNVLVLYDDPSAYERALVRMAPRLLDLPREEPPPPARTEIALAEETSSPNKG